MEVLKALCICSSSAKRYKLMYPVQWSNLQNPCFSRKNHKYHKLFDGPSSAIMPPFLLCYTRHGQTISPYFAHVSSAPNYPASHLMLKDHRQLQLLDDAVDIVSWYLVICFGLFFFKWKCTWLHAARVCKKITINQSMFEGGGWTLSTTIPCVRKHLACMYLFFAKTTHSCSWNNGNNMYKWRESSLIILWILKFFD